jgi:hypothetical protein
MESYFSSPFLLPKLLIVKTLYKKFVYFKQNYYICYLNSVADTATMDREHSERIRMSHIVRHHRGSPAVKLCLVRKKTPEVTVSHR